MNWPCTLTFYITIQQAWKTLKSYKDPTVAKAMFRFLISLILHNYFSFHSSTASEKYFH